MKRYLLSGELEPDILWVDARVPPHLDPCGGVRAIGARGRDENPRRLNGVVRVASARQGGLDTQEVRIWR